MNIADSNLVRAIVPKYIWKKFLAKKLPASILKYYDELPEEPSREIREALSYLRSNPVTVYPHPFQDQYKPDQVEVFDDHDKNLRYVLLDGKRLYFKRKHTRARIKRLFNLLSKEQDLKSPHRYLDEDFEFGIGDVLVDVGVAEGNFALSVVEKASRLILFETGKDWIEPLKATFEPWKDKVLIVNKFVSDREGSKSTTLDSCITSEMDPLFLKIDVEGAESRLLAGSKRILSEQRALKVAVCTYHKQNDEKEFRELLNRYGFRTSTSGGYMLYYYDKKIGPPYFRRGLIRAEKKP